jgi:methylated-DNA-protein-cysteine methyltransferase related protein
MGNRKSGARREPFASDPAARVDALRREIREVIRRIPRGRVATYGQVAELAGCPGAARLVAATLKTSPPSARLPWHRVIGKQAKHVGRIAILDPIGGAMQRAMLEREGVEVTARGHVPLRAHGWGASPPRPGTARRR